MLGINESNESGLTLRQSALSWDVHGLCHVSHCLCISCPAWKSTAIK